MEAWKEKGVLDIVHSDVYGPMSKRKIKILRFDYGEYTSKKLVAFCKAAEIRRELIVPHNLQHNSVAERKNRAIEESVKAMMNNQNLSMFLWREATMIAVYIQNRSLVNAEPSTFEEAVKKKEWKEAMMEEYQSIMMYGKLCLELKESL
jgi:hypothetical protein